VVWEWEAGGKGVWFQLVKTRRGVVESAGAQSCLACGGGGEVTLLRRKAKGGWKSCPPCAAELQCPFKGVWGDSFLVGAPEVCVGTDFDSPG